MIIDHCGFSESRCFICSSYINEGQCGSSDCEWEAQPGAENGGYCWPIIADLNIDTTQTPTGSISVDLPNN